MEIIGFDTRSYDNYYKALDSGFVLKEKVALSSVDCPNKAISEIIKAVDSIRKKKLQNLSTGIEVNGIFIDISEVLISLKKYKDSDFKLNLSKQAPLTSKNSQFLIDASKIIGRDRLISILKDKVKPRTSKYQQKLINMCIAHEAARVVSKNNSMNDFSDEYSRIKSFFSNNNFSHDRDKYFTSHYSH